MDRDKFALMKKIQVHGKEIMKQMRKTNRHSYDKYFDYVSPRKNRWVYRLFSTSHKSKDFSMNIYAYYQTKKSYVVLIYTPVTDRIMYHSSHFFTRYSERMEIGKDIVHDIIRQYMRENHNVVTSPIKEVENNIWQAFIQLSTGVGLGYKHHHINLVEMRTFIRNDMLKGNQVELSKQLEEKFKMHIVRAKPEE